MFNHDSKLSNHSDFHNPVSTELKIIYNTSTLLMGYELRIKELEEEISKLEKDSEALESHALKETKELNEIEDSLHDEIATYKELTEDFADFKIELSDAISDTVKELGNVQRKFRPSRNSILSLLREDIYVLRSYSFDSSEIYKLQEVRTRLNFLSKLIDENLVKLDKAVNAFLAKPKKDKPILFRYLENFLSKRKGRKISNNRGALLALKFKVNNLIERIDSKIESGGKLIESEKKQRELNEQINIQNLNITENAFRQSHSDIRREIYYTFNQQEVLRKKMQRKIHAICEKISKIENHYGLAIDVSKVKTHKDAVVAVKNLIDALSKIDPEATTEALTVKPKKSLSSNVSESVCQELWALSLVASNYEYLSYDDFVEFSKRKDKTIAIALKDDNHKEIAFLLVSINENDVARIHQFGVHPLYQGRDLEADLFSSFIKLKNDNSKKGPQQKVSQMVIDISECDESSITSLINLPNKLKVNVNAKLIRNHSSDSLDGIRFTLNM